METIQIESNQRKRRRNKIILWILFPLLLIPPFILANLSDKFIIYAFVSLLLAFIDIGVLYFMNNKYYNWPIGLFLIFCLSLFLKRNHWPMAGFILSFSTFFISIFSVVNSIRFQISFRHNIFLQWFGFISNIVVALFMIGVVFWAQHWPKEVGDVFSYTGCLLFIISILGMVFTLPNSNYIGWTVDDRKAFFRTIIIPMAFIFGLICLIFVFTNAFWLILNKDLTSVEWLVNDVKLFNLEGIPIQ
jgi:hypothetical protein